MILAFIILAIFLILATAAYAGARAAPYVPTRTSEKLRMLRLAGIKPGETVIDLGSGTGQLVIAAVREYQARGIGYEISLLPYLISQFWHLFHLGKPLSFRYRDFFTVNLSEADAIICFLTPYAMRRLGPKLKKELKPGSRVVSLAFAIQDLQLTQKDKPTPNATPVFLYHIS